MEKKKPLSLLDSKETKEENTNTMFDIIDRYKSISFIGMSKNAGKTTTLNYFIDMTRGKTTLGLSSVGRDGESLDRVTGTEKPKIYVYAGTIIATASSCLKLSDATLEILEITDFTTPMGKIVISRAITDGFVELAGPSTNWQTANVMEKMYRYGAKKVFIDGAISRKSLASPSVAEATIMATGASFAKTINVIARETTHSCKLLTVPKCQDELIQNKIKENHESTIIVDAENEVIFCDDGTIIGNEKQIAEYIDDQTKFIYTSGAITDSFLEILLRNTRLKADLTIVVHDGTKLFVSQENLNRIQNRKWILCAANKINLIAITVNPFSASDYSIDSKRIIEKLKETIEVPIFDVKRRGELE